VPAQEFRSSHSPFSLELHFRERNCAFASADNQIFVAAQDLSWLAAQLYH
jgi:hypothetical protein